MTSITSQSARCQWKPLLGECLFVAVGASPPVTFEILAFPGNARRVCQGVVNRKLGETGKDSGRTSLSETVSEARCWGQQHQLRHMRLAAVGSSSTHMSQKVRSLRLPWSKARPSDDGERHGSPDKVRHTTEHFLTSKLFEVLVRQKTN